VPGCSTGEEVYSLAISLLEFLEDKNGSGIPIQIFGTDISELALERARAGIYPPNISQDVSPERLRRFFTKVDGAFQIIKRIRELCVFARQNLAKDPPFSIST
jgi:two-component system CheB/CheR fusion protein